MSEPLEWDAKSVDDLFTFSRHQSLFAKHAKSDCDRCSGLGMMKFKGTYIDCVCWAKPQ